MDKTNYLHLSQTVLFWMRWRGDPVYNHCYSGHVVKHFHYCVLQGLRYIERLRSLLVGNIGTNQGL